MTDQTTPAPSWRPSERTAHGLMLYLGYGVLLIGAIALGLSFVSVDQAARPYFGAASWAIPVLMDSTIGVLTFFSIVAELNGLRAPLARYSARALVALTVYANIAPQHSLYGRILHGAPPVVWVIVVAVAEGLIRRLAGLADERRIEAVRRSLWLLRPVATWRIWRAMRVHQITTYSTALDRDAARAAVVGRLRLHHGRMWRGRAPLSERIALRLQGRDPQGVAAILADHQVTSALLARTVPEPVPGTAQETVEGNGQQCTEATPRPRRTAAPKRSRKTAKTPLPRRTDDELFVEASALNAQVLAATGTPVSLRRLKTDLRIGQPTAERLRDRLTASSDANPDTHDAVTEPVPVAVVDGAARTVEYANGSVV